MKKLSLDEIKTLQLDILSMFDAFCTEHDLRYQLAYGTLIGAVRHKGFIPWDDDIDLVMPVEDYRALVAIVNDMNSNGMMDDRYRLADMYVKSTIPYHQSFPKIYDTHTAATISGLRKDAGFKEAVFVDIFPVAGMPENAEKRDGLLKELLHVNEMLYWATKDVKASDFNPVHPRTAYNALRNWLASRKKPYNEWLQDYARLFKKFPAADGAKAAFDVKGYLMCGDTYYLTDNPWFPNIPIEFEGRMYPAPAHYDDLLRKFYGDYMQLPPEDQRQPLHMQDFFLIK